MGICYGYARVSAKDQNEARQLHALKEFGVKLENIFLDKQTGSDFNRNSYKQLFRKLKKDDVLVIKSIDRLGRNYKEILKQWQYITNELGADIVVIDIPLLDTRCSDGNLTGVFISNLVLQILSYVAEVERENIKVRQREGIDLAIKKGVEFGRPKKMIPDNFLEIQQRFNNNELTSREAARLLFVSQSTFLRWNKKIG